MNTLLQHILPACDRREASLRDTRRALHRIPELGFQEHKTAAFIAERLTALGFKPECGIAGTGITARLSFARPGPTVVLRADMDALPVKEETGADFASLHDGLMHACGHDGHMAMALGAAEVLAELAASPLGADLAGSVVFVFQPAEESLGGAKPMVESGILEGVDFCLAAHVWPELPEGAVGVRSGPCMASMDAFEITLTGKGGHGSQPHLCSDVVGAVAQLTVALQQIVPRRVSPLLPATLGICALQAGDAYNVFPQTAVLKGSIRTFQQEVRAVFQESIEQVVRGVSASFGVTPELRFARGDGPVQNDPHVAQAVRGAAAKALGEDRVAEPPLALAGEDFSRFTDAVPGCMFFLGSGGAESKPLHNPAFSFDERILCAGVKVFCLTALDLLNGGRD